VLFFSWYKFRSPLSSRDARILTLAKLNIPERYRSSLSSIRSLSEQDVQEIRSILDQVAPAQSQRSDSDIEISTDPRATLTAVTTTASRAHITNFKQILEVLVTLYEIKSQRDTTTVEEFVDAVCDAMEGLDSEVRLPHEQRADFAGKLLTLLNAEVFALVAKTHDLATEDERTFCHARILTDLRPVFGPNIEEGPKAMLAMHTLKLAYHEQDSQKHRSFYVSLGAEDLQALKKIIQRAEDKAKTLNAAVNNIRLFGIPREKE